MGSDAHYPEEAPAHAVTVDGFWIDRFAVTNAQFAVFVAATGYLTVAERPLDPGLPGAPARTCRRVDGVHAHDRPRGPAPPEPVVDLDAGRVVAPSSRAPGLVRVPRPPGRAHRVRGRRGLRGLGRQGTCPPRPSGSSQRGWARRRAFVWGDEPRDRGSGWPTTGTATSLAEHDDGYGSVAGRLLSGERLRAPRHGRERVGVDGGLVVAATLTPPTRSAACPPTPGRRPRTATTRPSRSSASPAR